jgi:hypothetical protein
VAADAACMKIFKPDHERYEGVRPINVYLLRLLFLLVTVFVVSDSWSAILKHQGTWEPIRAAAVCMWAAYSLICVIGIVHPLRLLPIVLFEIVYKLLWLAVVAWPLWSTNRLAGSPAEEMTSAFIWVVLPIVAMPWGYAFRTLVLNRKAQERSILVA